MHRTILAAGFLAASALFSFADDPTKRIWVTLDPEATERMYEVLREETVSRIDFDGAPLEEVLDYLSGLIGHEIQLDNLALDELGLGPDEPVVIKAQSLKLGAVLKLLLDPLELTCIVQNGALIITTEDEALCRLTTAVYPVGDLLLYDEHGPNYDSLVNVVTMTIAADTWAENGGGEAEIRPYPQRASIVVSQMTSVHESIASLLNALRRPEVDSKAKLTPAPNGHGYEPGGGGRPLEGSTGGGTFSLERGADDSVQIIPSAVER
ncbi:hypothetical protein MalM25_04870 [Planctomycetes bacterium MalM25]|nr:hypothetical protein MalM25_04870 [Planctomycetes bacterium MalM25]